MLGIALLNSMILQLLIRDGPVRVSLLNYVEDGFPVQYIGAGTGALLKVVGKATGGCVFSLAKRAGDIASTINRRFEVLYVYIMSALHVLRFKDPDAMGWSLYHLETIFALKLSATGPAVGFEETHTNLVQFRHHIVKKCRIAGHTGHSVPVPDRRHMLVGSALREKLARASLAIKARCPVSCIVHVLFASAPGTKGATAYLTFRPMVTVIHMFFAGILAIKGSFTSLALVHCDRRGSEEDEMRRMWR